MSDGRRRRLAWALLTVAALADVAPQVARASDADAGHQQVVQVFSDALGLVQRNYVLKPDDRRLVKGAIEGMSKAWGGAVPSISDAALAEGARSPIVEFEDALNRIEQTSSSKPDERPLVEAAIRGMLRSGVSDAAYLSQSDVADMSGQNYGPTVGSPGLTLGWINGLPRVEAVQEDGPAKRAGVQIGDVLTEVDGHDLTDLSLQDVTRWLRGPTGQAVELTVRRDSGPPLHFAVAREHLAVGNFKARLVGDIAVLRVASIPNGETAHAAISAFFGKYPLLKGVVLDLRGCPGGAFNGSIELADEFLDGGEVVEVRGRDPKIVDRYNARPGDVIGGRPLVVLIDQNTQSGAEVVAAALQDRKRAEIVGLPSFGAGTIDTVMPLPGGKDGAIRMVTAFTYRISGDPLQRAGVTPDLMVAQSRADADRAVSSKGFFSTVDITDSLVPAGAPTRIRPASVDAPAMGYAGDYQETRALERLRAMIH